MVQRNNTIINGNKHTLQGNGTGTGNGFGLSNVSNVTVKTTTITHFAYGIYLNSASGNVLSGNTITSNTYGGVGLFHSSDNNILSGSNVTAAQNGITLYSSDNNTLSGNIVTTNGVGFSLSLSSGNVLSGNNVTSNIVGIEIVVPSFGNGIFHNNFLNNSLQKQQFVRAVNIWDDGYPSGGNYWSNYNGTDLFSGHYQNISGSDGIGDSPYAIFAGNMDNYPLMAPFKSFDAGTWNNVSYSVDMISNSTLSNFSFDPTARTLTFDATGTNGTMGFLRVAIPKRLMWTNNDAEWAVTINGTLIGDRLITNDTSNTYIYFAYPQSTKTIKVQGTGAVPEFQSLQLILPLLMAVALLAAIVFKRKRNHNKIKTPNPLA